MIIIYIIWLFLTLKIMDFSLFKSMGLLFWDMRIMSVLIFDASSFIINNSVGRRLSRYSKIFCCFHMTSYFGNGGSSLKAPLIKQHTNNVWRNDVPLILIITDIVTWILLSKLLDFLHDLQGTPSFHYSSKELIDWSRQTDCHSWRTLWFFCLVDYLHDYKI